MRALKVTAGLAISALFCYLALRGIELTAVLTVLSGAAIVPIVFGCSIFILTYIIRALRWKIMLAGVSPAPGFHELLSAIFIGAAANNLLPLRAGEFVRAYAVKRFGDVSGKTAISSIVLERVLDGISLLIILGVLLASNPFPAWVSRLGLIAVLIFGGAIVALAFAFYKRRCIAEKIKRREWLAPTIERFQDGLSLFANMRNFISVVFLSLIVWCLEAVVYWFVGESLGLGLSVPAILLCLAVVNFGLIIPSSPGFVGTFEYACIISLGAFSIVQNAALGFAILLHVLFWIILVAGGLLFAWIDHGGFFKVTRTKEEAI